MDREEILRRSREEGRDEWEEQMKTRVEFQERRWATWAIMIGVLLLSAFDLAEGWLTSAILLVMLVPAIGWRLYGYVRTRKGEYLAAVVIGIVALVMVMANLFQWMIS